MNKIYKVIWSKVRNCYVAVSEIAKRNGKSCTSVNCGAKANRGHAGAALALALSLSLAGGGVAWAESYTTITTSDQVYVSSDNSDSESVYLLQYPDGTIEDTGAKITVLNGATILKITGSYNGNTITVNSGGKVLEDIKGGGNSYNRVYVSGTVSGTVYGGYHTDSVTENKVYINGGTVEGKVYGGYSKGDSNGSGVTNNLVQITNNGTVKGKIYGGQAQSKTAFVNNNRISIDGGDIQGTIYGGYRSSGTGPVTDNVIVIKQASVKDVYGAYIYDDSPSSGASPIVYARFNEVKLDGASVNGNIWGGYITGGHGRHYPTDNKLILLGTDNSVTGNIYNFSTYTLEETLQWDPGKSVLTANAYTFAYYYNSPPTPTYDISSSKLRDGTTYGKMTLFSSNTNNMFSSAYIKYNNGTSVTGKTLGDSAPRLVVKEGTATEEQDFVKGVKLAYNEQEHIVSLDTANSYKNVLYSIADNVTGITFGEMEWGTPRDGSDSGTHFDFGGVTTIDTSGLTFANPQTIAKDATTFLLENATNLPAGSTNISHSQNFSGYNIGNGVTLDATLNGTVTRTTAGQVGYRSNGTTLNSVDITGWNGTASDTDTVPTGWLKPNSGSDYVSVTIGDNFSAPSLTAGATPQNILTSSNTFFNDANITDNTNKDKYQSFDLTGDTTNYVTFAGTQYKGVKASDDHKNLIYAADKKNVTGITFDSGMTWGTGRTASSDYNFSAVTNNNISVNGLSFTNPEAIEKDATMTLLAGATNLAVGANIAHSQSISNYNAGNGVKLNATLQGTVVRETADQIGYKSNGTTLDTIDLKDWDINNSAAIPANWLAKEGGAPINNSGDAISGLDAGVVKTILTASTSGYFGTVNQSDAFSSQSFSQDYTDMIFSGDHYKGVKVEADGKTLNYYAETKDVTGITLGNITWGTTTGRTAGDLYIFNNVNSIDASGLNFTNPDEVSGSMYLLSGATGLTAGAVADISHTQANFIKTMDNSTKLTATLAGTISTSEAGKVKYTAIGTTISTIDLSGWDSTKEAATVPAGWTLARDAQDKVTAEVKTVNGDNVMTPPDLAYGQSKVIITATGTNYFDGIKITGTHAWSGISPIEDTDQSGVSIIGTSTGTGVKVNEVDKNQIIYQKTKDSVTTLALSGIEFENNKTVRTFGNTYDLTTAAIAASDGLFTEATRSKMETGNSMTLVNATGAIKNASNETLSTFNGGTSKSYVIDFTDTIATKSLSITGKHTDTLAQSDDSTTSTKKSLLTYTVGYKNVTKATLSGDIAWSDSGVHYTNGSDVNQNGVGATYTFNGNSEVDISRVAFNSTADPLAGTTKTMTLLKGVNGVVQAKVTGSPSFTVSLDQTNTKLDAKATGSATVNGNDVDYTVSGVAIDKVNVKSVGSSADTIPANWTLATGATIETGSGATAMTVPTGLAPGQVKPIITSAVADFFEGIAIKGDYAWQAGGALPTTPENGVAVTGTQTAGGVKVNKAAKNEIVYEQSKKNVTGLTLSGIAFANNTTARSFGSDYDLTAAAVTAGDADSLFTEATRAVMEPNDSMILVDATGAIKNASNETLAQFNGGAAKTYNIAFSDTITGKGLALAGTHTDTLAQDAAKTKLTYTVGAKDVSTATLSGAIAWSDGGVHYTNGSDANQNGKSTLYTFSGNTAVDIGGVAFSTAADPLAGATKSMTLLKNVNGVASDKVTGTPTFAVTLDQANTKLDAKATGSATVSGNDVVYAVSGVAIDKVTVKSTGNTADKVPANWTLAAGATVETDGMTVPTLDAGTHVDILQSDTDGFFANVPINGANAYGKTQDTFTESDAGKGVTIAGNQDKGVTYNSEKNHVIYKAGTKDVASVTLGSVAWQKGATLLDASGAGYDYSKVASLNMNGLDVSYASPETVAAGDSMTLLQANATLKDMAEQAKQTAYSYAPVSGVTVDGNITGKLAASGGAVTYTAAENKANKLTFTNVDWKDSGALMTRPANITFAGADVDTAKIGFNNVTSLEADQKMTLVSDFGSQVGTITGTKYMIGTTNEGEGSASLDNGNLIFTTKTGTGGAAEQTHRTVMATEAGVATLAAGQDYVDSAVEGLGLLTNIAPDGTSTFAAMGGGASRYKTGSHVDTHTWNAVVAVGSKRDHAKGSLEWGVFAEYGRGNYTLHNDDGGRGDGDTHYAGGGLLAKWTNKHNVYTEASFRMGRISDSASNMLQDGVGNQYGYNVHATYYGGHVGVGKLYEVKKNHELDVYGKFFYTRRNGVSFNAAGQYDLDAVSSSLLRVGARYGTTDKKWNWYGGLAYEYQFDGEAKGMLNGNTPIRAASIKGGSVRGEIGMRMDATKTNPWKTDISIYGYGGRHRGFGGNVSVAYMF